MPMFDLPDGRWMVDVHGASKHFNTDQEFNENNRGVGLQYQWDGDNNLIHLLKGGQYLNSLNNDSKYLAYGLKKRLMEKNGWHLDAGGLFGGMTGYTDGITPAILPQLTIGNGAFGLNIMGTPEIPNFTPATLMFSTEIPLK